MSSKKILLELLNKYNVLWPEKAISVVQDIDNEINFIYKDSSFLNVNGVWKVRHDATISCPPRYLPERADDYLNVTYRPEVNELAVYPCLKYFVVTSKDDSKFAVLFSSTNIGLVVYDPSNIHGLYHYSEKWVEEEFIAVNDPQFLIGLKRDILYIDSIGV